MDERNNYFIVDFDDDFAMPGNADGYHQSAIDFWQKELPSIKASKRGGGRKSKSDENDNDDLQELIDRFRKIADNISIDDIWDKLTNGSEKHKQNGDDDEMRAMRRIGFGQLMQQQNPIVLQNVDNGTTTTNIDDETTVCI